MNYQSELTIKLNNQAEDVIKELPHFCRKFFNHLKGQGSSPRTILQYAYDINKFFEYLYSAGGFKKDAIRNVPASEVLDRLKIDDLQEYFKSMENYTTIDENGAEIEHLTSPAAKARRVSSLRSLYKYYYKLGEIESNLAELIDIPKIPEKNIIVMNKDQVSRILNAVKDTEGLTERQIKRKNLYLKRDYAILMLFFGTGLRVSELVGINVLDVDFYEACILVTRKGGDQDEVFFGPEVEQALLEYLEDERDKLLKGNTSEDAFFVSMQHQRMGVRAIELMIKTYAKKAGLNINVTPHALRRTFGTHLYESTGDIYLVADALHHSSVDTTKKHYARMSKEHKRIAASKSSELFDNN